MKMKVRLEDMGDQACFDCWDRYGHDFNEDLYSCQCCTYNINYRFLQLLAYKTGKCRFCKNRIDLGDVTTCKDGIGQIQKCKSDLQLVVDLQAIVDEYGIETLPKWQEKV